MRAKRPFIPWRPLNIIGGLVVTIAFVVACGAIIFTVSHSDLPEEPTPEPRPENAEEYVFRGIDFADQGEFERAIQDFTESIRLDPNRKEAYLNRGVTHNKLERYQEAIADFSAAIALEPKYERAYANRALSYTLLDMDTEAETDIERAVELGVSREALEQIITGAKLSR